MSRIVYVNGRYVPYGAAMVHVEDRGYQFSDGVYEVCEVRGGRIVDERRHLDRLQRSLGELRIRAPMSRAALGIVMGETIRRNRVRNRIVYLQVTRGVAHRDHAFPPLDTAPSVVVSARRTDIAANEKIAAEGIAVITVPDNRWARPDIKTISLLPNVLAKQAAREQGARETWFIDRQGYVTEGSSTNAWIVTGEGKVVTRPADQRILRGITRTVLVEAISGQGLQLEERAFALEEVFQAQEAFVTAASQIVMPVVRLDGHPIGNGSPGPIAQMLRRVFHSHAEWG